MHRTRSCVRISAQVYVFLSFLKLQTGCVLGTTFVGPPPIRLFLDALLLLCGFIASYTRIAGFRAPCVDGVGHTSYCVAFILTVPYYVRYIYMYRYPVKYNFNLMCHVVMSLLN